MSAVPCSAVFQTEMADMETQTVLRCGLCGKPFDKRKLKHYGRTFSALTGHHSYKIVEATLKRHGYYCRSRTSESRPARLRSCVACAKAKKRCDGQHPGCT